jgi:transcriptional regulator with XRE-family HTH domain
VRTTHQQRIGQRIAAAREAKGWSQRELADELGVSETQISRYERGRTSPKPARYEALANALEVPAETFFYDPPAS